MSRIGCALPPHPLRSSPARCGPGKRGGQYATHTRAGTGTAPAWDLRAAGVTVAGSLAPAMRLAIVPWRGASTRGEGGGNGGGAVQTACCGRPGGTVRGAAVRLSVKGSVSPAQPCAPLRIGGGTLGIPCEAGAYICSNNAACGRPSQPFASASLAVTRADGVWPFSFVYFFSRHPSACECLQQERRRQRLCWRKQWRFGAGGAAAAAVSAIALQSKSAL